MKPNDEYAPFSNGSEYRHWIACNCERDKGCRSYNPEASSSRHGCPMEVALSLGVLTGTIKAKHGLRCGLLSPGPNGEIVDDRVPRPCPEYRGRDEPDDRPRRGPGQPEGQMDLLDPRHVRDEAREAAKR